MTKWQCSSSQALAAEDRYWNNELPDSESLEQMRAAITAAVGPEVDALLARVVELEEWQDRAWLVLRQSRRQTHDARAMAVEFMAIAHTEAEFGEDMRARIETLTSAANIERVAEAIYRSEVEQAGTTLRAWKTDAPWDSDPEHELCEWERDEYRETVRAVARALRRWVGKEVNKQYKP